MKDEGGATGRWGQNHEKKPISSSLEWKSFNETMAHTYKFILNWIPFHDTKKSIAAFSKFSFYFWKNVWPLAGKSGAFCTKLRTSEKW